MGAPHTPAEPPDLSGHSLAITEHAPLPMATVEGSTHRVRYANPAFCRLMGQPLEGLVGKRISELLPQKDQCVTLLDRVFRFGAPASHTEQEDATPHPVFWSYTMWPVQAPAGLVGIMIQVTESVRSHELVVAMNQALLRGSLRQHELVEAAEEVNTRLRVEIAAHERTTRELAEKARLLELTQDAIIVGGYDDRITLWNKGAERTYGWTAGEVIGDDLHVLLRTEFPQPREDLMVRLHREGQFEGEVTQVARDGRRLTSLCRWVLDRDTRSILNSYKDITQRRQAQLAAHQLAAIVESSGDAIIGKTLDGVITSWNRAAETLFGYTATEAIGRSTLELIVPPDLSGMEREVLRSVTRGERVAPTETVRLRKGGAPMQVSLAVSPVRDAAGAVVAASSITRDITGRKDAEAALRASEARHKAILETALDCVITIDAEGRVLDFNPAAERTFGYTQAQALGQPLHELIIPEELHAAHLAGLARYRQSGEARIVGRRVEMAARRADGQRLLVELALTRIPVAGQTLFTAYLRDITGRRQAEELQLAKEEAERANVAKSEFLSRMSHELRTPLNAILGFSQLLELDALTDAQHEGVRQIIGGGRHLLKLINEVLDIARVESGHVEMSPEAVNVADLVGETLNLVRPLANERGVWLEPGPLRHGVPPGAGPHVRADRQRLMQALLNLLSNAIKYNVPGGRVTLDHTVTGERLRLRVTDTGPGIPAHQRARLFTPFDRLGAEHSDVEGTGLGLALSKRLMEAMGGSLGVEAEAPAPAPAATGGKTHPGATFWLEVPVVSGPIEILAAGHPDATLDPTGTEPLPGDRTVLLIEDNLSNVTLVERLMEAHPGVRLISAMQGTLGLDLARQHRPDLVLLDVHLPDVPGWEVLAQLQADESTRHIPVVVLSADATEAQVRRLMQAGAHAYLTKPLDVRKFLGVVREVLLAG